MPARKQRPSAKATFRQRFLDARLRAGLSQKELGIRAGLDESVASTRINRYEVGAHQPDLTILGALADQLQVPTAYFFAEEDRLARLILAFAKLTTAKQVEVVTAVESAGSSGERTSI